MDDLIAPIRVATGDSILLGMVYILLASGLATVFSIMRIVNFAHGEFYMLGAFGIYYLYQQWRLPFPIALVVSTLGVGALGILLERGFFRPFKAPEFHMLAMIVSMGLIVLIEGLAFALFKPEEKLVHTPFVGYLDLLGARLPVQKAVVGAVSLITIIALVGFIKWSKWGQALRAVADDEQAAALQGIGVDFARGLAMLIGAALAAMAGGLMAGGMAIHPAIGETALLKAFVVVVLGGLGSIGGAAIGGLLLGVVEGYGTFFLGYWVFLLIFVLVMLFLVARPKGLMGSQ